ncbi:MAG: replicative DNA helicase, partial [Spirochaetota bacterium]|nr:replicative DNA helicase [Spirochaetota bacterium]
DIITESYQGSEDVYDLVDMAESRIFNIAHQRISEDFLPIKPALTQTLDHIEKLYHTKGGYTGIPSGFIDLDKITGGFQKSDLIIIAARPSMGKTAFCLNITENASVKFKQGIAFFSLEMSKQQLCQRLISSYSRMDSQKLRMGNIEPKDFTKIAATISQLSKVKIYLDDTPSITPLEIRAKARRLMARDEINLIIIDYLQLISGSPSRRSENRQNEIAEISRSLKVLARELEIPVIVISQLSRGVEIRGGDHRPKLSDLRDSGAIEQDADVVMFIYRDEYYHQDDPEVKGKAELIIAKQRNGPTGVINLAFNSSHTRFDNFVKLD